MPSECARLGFSWRSRHLSQPSAAHRMMSTVGHLRVTHESVSICGWQHRRCESGLPRPRSDLRLDRRSPELFSPTISNKPSAGCDDALYAERAARKSRSARAPRRKRLLAPATTAPFAMPERSAAVWQVRESVLCKRLTLTCWGNTSDAGGSGTPRNSPKNRLSERS